MVIGISSLILNSNLFKETTKETSEIIQVSKAHVPHTEEPEINLQYYTPFSHQGQV